MVQKITNFHLNQARKTENEGVMIESERQSKRYASGGNRDSERWSTWCMCVTKRENKQTMQCVLHRQTILLSASFTLLFVFIPASISKTWLKCSSYQRLCWTTGEKKKKTVRWEEKWSGKVKSIFYSVTLFILHRQQEEKTDIQTLFSSLLSCSVSFTHSPQQLNPPDTCISSSIASPEQHFSHTFSPSSRALI